MEPIDDGAFIYSYDKAGRFIGKKAKYSGHVESSFNYDKNGNRISGFENNKKFSAVFDNHDRLLNFNKISYQYNPNGDLLSKTENGITTNYNYDSFGNLRNVNRPGFNIEYDTDHQGRRVAKRVNGTVVARYVWQDQLRLAAELDGAGNLIKQFVYADGVNSPDYMIYQGKKYLFSKDHRGSITMVVDSVTGEMKQKVKYSDWGEILEDTNPGLIPFGYAGGMYDQDTKLVRFGARDYDSQIGRWLAKDPIRFDGGDTNLYGYVFQNSVNYTDPSGKVLPIIAGLVAYNIGFGIGACFNKARGHSFSETYDGVNPGKDLIEQILPGTDLLSQPETQAIINDGINNDGQGRIDQIDSRLK